ncbi:hypothetical protein [Streptomyces sp. SLBN-8D4]|uniref:hypothetical protein n=1 Tax=Streptomyces sp. SLBN-8D4 TaxID=3377728 RepID=UPI003C7C1862
MSGWWAYLAATFSSTSQGGPRPDRPAGQPSRVCTKSLSADPVTAPPPSPRTVAGWILRHPESLSEGEQLRMKAVLAHCPELEALTRHVRSFAQVLTERHGQRLPE